MKKARCYLGREGRGGGTKTADEKEYPGKMDGKLMDAAGEADLSIEVNCKGLMRKS